MTFEEINGCLPVQVSEMLCIYCLKAISNPSIYIYIKYIHTYIHNNDLDDLHLYLHLLLL